MRVVQRTVCPATLLLVFATIGCSSSNIANAVATANNANIKRVGNLYGSYLFHNSWQGPKDEKELTRYLHDNLSEKKLGMMGIDPQNVNAVFVSERDGKPFKVRWGLSVPPLSTVVVVFETEGVGGKKQVATNNGEVREVEDAEYQRLWGEKQSASPPASPPTQEGIPAAAAKPANK